MAIIDLEFMERYQNNLDTAIKNYVKDKNPNEKGESIPSGTNINDMKTAGVFYIANDTIASNITNLPLSLCGKLMVMDNGNGGIVQIYVPNHTSRLFERLWWDNSWGNWVEYAKKGTVYQQALSAGSTSVTFTGLPTTGNYTFDIYTSKVGLDYSSITASSGSLTLVYEAQSSIVTVYLVVGEI